MLDDLKVAISEKDVQKARKILTEELISTNYPREVFDEAIELADTYEVFDVKDEECLKSDPKEWDMDYLTTILDNLDENFSKEKFMTAYNVARKIEKELESSNRNCVPSIIQRTYEDHKKIFIGAGIGAVAAVVSIIGLGIYINKKKK